MHSDLLAVRCATGHTGKTRATPVKYKQGVIMTVEQTARVCHESNKARCESLGDTSQLFKAVVSSLLALVV